MRSLIIAERKAHAQLEEARRSYETTYSLFLKVGAKPLMEQARQRLRDAEQAHQDTVDKLRDAVTKSWH